MDGGIIIVFADFCTVIVRIRKKRIFAVLFLVILIVCIGISQYHIYPDTWVAFEWLVKTTRYAPLYLLGVYTARFHAQKVLQETYRHKVLGICALLVCVISLIRLSCRSAWGVSEWFLCQVLPVAVWLIPSSRLFQKEIGFPLRISFLIYATHHLMVIPLLNAVYLDFLAERTWTVYGVILLRVPGTLLVYLVTLGIAVFLKSILKPKVFEALSGGRM